jgi:hypothetical protein
MIKDVIMREMGAQRRAGVGPRNAEATPPHRTAPDRQPRCRPRRRSNCATGCVLRCCAGASAKALDLIIPETLLATADEVIQ